VTTATGSAHNPPAHPPRSLIVTVFGAYAREIGGFTAVADLIKLMADLGVDEPAVRSAISRLKRRGIVEAQRSQRAAGYRLSAQAERLFADGDRRIFDRPAATLDDGWVLAVFSIPEPLRHKRHALRSRLVWLGFGSAAPGVWIAPAQLGGDVRRAIEQLELTPYVSLFRADHLAFAELRRAVASWWDLDGLAQRYDEFLTTYQPMLARWQAKQDGDDLAAFTDHVDALTSWRRMPFLDPGLPSDLLPARWHGARAAELFARLHRRLSGPALGHVRATIGQQATIGHQGSTATPSSSTSASMSHSRTTPTSAIAG
jgi:phenylacetic acid degradation operon negative regulatory protein